MTDPLSFAWLHDAVTWLLTPALGALMLACAIALIEAGIAVGERTPRNRIAGVLFRPGKLVE